MRSLQQTFDLALADHRAGRLLEAARGYGAIVGAEPRASEALRMLGLVSFQLGELGRAVELLDRAARLAPAQPSCHANLGLVLTAAGRYTEAEHSLRQALSLDPNRPDTLNHLGDALLHSGRLDEAIAAFRQSLAVRPHPAVGSKLLILLHCHPESTTRSLLREHLRWNQTFTSDIPRIAPPTSPRREGPLRIGYVSPVLSQNPVGRFLLPVLIHHDRSAFEIFCYTDTPVSDPLAAPLRQASHAWRCTAGLDDAAVADMIRADGIDILVDLAAHTEGNRLLAFARRPAPVQVTWLSYCSTTGLSEMDYRLSDPNLDPPGSDLSNYTEQTIHLPQTYWCYPAHANVPQVNPLPAQVPGRVTFGCLCNFIKLTRPTLALWAELLRALPDARLALSTQHHAHRHFISSNFAAAGIDPATRIEFLPALALPDYFRVYSRIDIALDPFPYPGGTTTCDALYMGVPTITLPGATAVSRAGASLLANVGLNDLVAASPQHYLALATSLAHDLPRLAALRASLRPRLVSSPIMDALNFTRGLEKAFRNMWERSLRADMNMPGI